MATKRKQSQGRKSDKRFDFAQYPNFLDTVTTSKRTLFQDAECRPLWLRVQGDRRSYVFSGRIAGGGTVQAVLPLQRHDSLALGEARALARTFRERARAGCDPRQDTGPGMMAGSAETTLCDALRAYSEFARTTLGRRERTVQDLRDRADYLERHGESIGTTPLVKLTAHRLDAWLDQYRQRARERGHDGLRSRNLWAQAFNTVIRWAGSIHPRAARFPNHYRCLSAEGARAMLCTVLPEGDSASGGQSDDEPDQAAEHGIETKHKPLAMDEARALYATLRTMRGETDTAPLFEFILLCGERSHAARHLKWKHVDRVAGKITIPKGIRKNNLQLTLPITDAMRSLLDDMAQHPLAQDRESYVFPSRRGTSVGPGRVEHVISGQLSGSCRHVAKAVERAGGPAAHFSPQSLRVTVSYHLAELAVPRDVRQHILGHGDLGNIHFRSYENAASYFDLMRDALERWNATLSGC